MACVGDWKIVYYQESQTYELFNLARDLAEQVNLAGQRPNVRDRLAAVLGNQLVSMEAQMARIKATGEEVPYPGPDLTER